MNSENIKASDPHRLIPNLRITKSDKYFALLHMGKYKKSLTKAITVSYDHVMYALQSESTLYNCVNVRNSLLETDTIFEV